MRHAGPSLVPAVEVAELFAATYPGAAKNEVTSFPSSTFQTKTCPSNVPPAKRLLAAHDTPSKGPSPSRR